MKNAVLEFFRNGDMVKQINHTTLALIPKSSHANEVSDFRPIACCNIIYKLTSKILASRLAVVMDNLIDKAQSAFVEGRCISDNIHLAEALLRQYQRARTSPKCMLIVDLRKAFDSVDWTFLESLLSEMKFPQVFINWIMACVSTTSFSLSINGELSGLFTGKKGLRQGDPLSPYLFVLCLDYFSRILKAKTQLPDFNYHPKCKTERIPHLAFADDLLLFSR